jgi:hypothetical protein
MDIKDITEIRQPPLSYSCHPSVTHWSLSFSILCCPAPFSAVPSYSLTSHNSRRSFPIMTSSKIWEIQANSTGNNMKKYYLPWMHASVLIFLIQDAFVKIVPSIAGSKQMLKRNLRSLLGNN